MTQYFNERARYEGTHRTKAGGATGAEKDHAEFPDSQFQYINAFDKYNDPPGKCT